METASARKTNEGDDLQKQFGREFSYRGHHVLIYPEPLRHPHILGLSCVNSRLTVGELTNQQLPHFHGGVFGGKTARLFELNERGEIAFFVAKEI